MVEIDLFESDAWKYAWNMQLKLVVVVHPQGI